MGWTADQGDEEALHQWQLDQLGTLGRLASTLRLQVSGGSLTLCSTKDLVPDSASLPCIMHVCFLGKRSDALSLSCAGRRQQDAVISDLLRAAVCHGQRAHAPASDHRRHDRYEPQCQAQRCGGFPAASRRRRRRRPPSSSSSRRSPRCRRRSRRHRICQNPCAHRVLQQYQITPRGAGVPRVRSSSSVDVSKF